MTVAELYERTMTAMLGQRTAGFGALPWHVCIAHEDYESLKNEAREWIPAPAFIGGLSIVVDQRLEPGEVRLRCEVKA